MEFFSTAVTSLSTVVTAIGAGVGVWGIINLMEGYGGDNPASKSQGVKQLMAGGGVILLGVKERESPFFLACSANVWVTAYGFYHRRNYKMD